MAGETEGAVTFVFVVMGGIGLFVFVIGLLDWLAERKDKPPRSRAA